MTISPIKKARNFPCHIKVYAAVVFTRHKRIYTKAFATYSVLHFSADDRETVYTFAFFMKSTVRGGAALIF